MSEWDDEETTGVKDLKALAAREGVLELVDEKVMEILKRYNESVRPPPKDPRREE